MISELLTTPELLVPGRGIGAYLSPLNMLWFQIKRKQKASLSSSIHQGHATVSLLHLAIFIRSAYVHMSTWHTDIAILECLATLSQMNFFPWRHLIAKSCNSWKHAWLVTQKLLQDQFIAT